MREYAEMMRESELLDLVVETARRFGWLVHHDRPAQNRRGVWATHVQGDPGFPDLVLVRGDRCFVVELKRERGQPTPAQSTWLEAFARVQRVETRLWRPRDWLSGRVLDELAAHNNADSHDHGG